VILAWILTWSLLPEHATPLQPEPQEHLEDLWEQGRVAYQAGQYAQALELYQEALLDVSPEDSSALLYNLGNCAFRLDRFAEAAWYYRRSLRGNPEEPQALTNLALAERELGINLAHLSWPQVMVNRWRTCPAHFQLWGLLLLQALGLLLLAVKFPRWRPASVGLLLFLLGAAGSVDLYRQVPSKDVPEAVVLSDRVPLRNVPHFQQAAFSHLQAGQCVTILERSERWWRVRQDTLMGWAPRSKLGAVE
jgi:tetratricopeptide (TPR) repeat protein